MTRDCSLNSLKNTCSEHVVYKNCFFLFLFWHSKQYLYTTCCKFVFWGEFNEQSLVILWVNWCKNKSFWQRFTCTGKSFSEALILASVNPQYIWQEIVHWIPPKNTSLEHIVYKNCFFVFVLTFKTIFVHNMFWTCIFRGIQWTISCHTVG